MLEVGDRVTSVSVGGLQMAAVPCTGTYGQNREVTGILRGEGVILEVLEYVIDYDSWPENYQGLGKIAHWQALVQCGNATGWCGSGAIKLWEANALDRSDKDAETDSAQ